MISRNFINIEYDKPSTNNVPIVTKGFINNKNINITDIIIIELISVMEVTITFCITRFIF